MSEVPLFICQMVYAEIVLSRNVDWSTVKASKHVIIPSKKRIPTAGLGSKPRDGMGSKKLIKAGVPDEEYVWSDHSSSASEEELQKDVTSHPMGTMEEMSTKVQEGQDMATQTLTMSSVEEMPRDEEHRGALVSKSSSTNNEISNNACLQMLLEELARKEEECVLLRNQIVMSLDDNSVFSLRAQIESGQTTLALQQRDFQELEAFYMRFKSQYDGASSSTTNMFAQERLAILMKECEMEGEYCNNARRGIEEAQAKLQQLNEIRHLDPLDRVQHMANLYETSEIEVAKLKKMFTNCLSLEAKLRKAKGFENMDDHV